MNIINKQTVQLFIVTIFFSMMTVPLFAQDNLNLSKAISIGLSNNFGIKIQKIEEDIVQNQLNNVYKRRIPKVDLFARQQNNSNNNSSPTSFVQGFYSDRGLDLGLDANWIIFEGFKARLDKSRLEKLNRQSNGNTMLLVENTIHAIMLAYYNTLIKKEAVAVQHEAGIRSKERFNDAKFQFEKGKVSGYDLLRFENAMLIDSTNSIIQLKEFDIAMQTLNLAMGNKFYKVYQLTDKLDYQKEDYQFSKLQQKMISLNKELQNQYLNLMLRRNDIGILKANQYPKFAINSGLSQNFNSTKFQGIDRIKGGNFRFYLNFSVTYNLFDGGQINRAIDEGRLKEKIADLEIDQVKQELSNVLKKAVTNYNMQLQIIRINEKLINNLKQNLILEKGRYKNGFSSLLEYRSLQQENIDAEQTRLEAIYELLISETEILKLTGSLLKYYPENKR